MIDFDGDERSAGRARIESRSLSGKTSGKNLDVKKGNSKNQKVTGVPKHVVSTHFATAGVPLSRDTLAGFRVAIKQHATYDKVWTSEATGSRRAASFWVARFEQGFATKNRDRVNLGSYLTPGLSDPSRYAPVSPHNPNMTLPPGQFANALEVCDTKAWALSGSPHLANVIEVRISHPSRTLCDYCSVWSTG